MVHLIQHNLACLCCAQAATAAAPFPAREGDKAEAVKPLYISVTHTISIWIISTQTAEHTSNKRHILLLPSINIMGKWHIPFCLIFLYYNHIWKKPTNLPLAQTVPVMRCVWVPGLRTQLSTHNSRSRERPSLSCPEKQRLRARHAFGTQTLWRNPQWLKTELTWNNDCKTTGEGVKPPLTTALMNSQKSLAKGKCISVVWQTEVTWARLPSSIFSSAGQRGSTGLQHVPLWVAGPSRAHKLGLSHSPSFGADLFFPGQRRGCVSLNSDTRSGFSFQLRLQARQEIPPHGTWCTVQEPKPARFLGRVGEDHSYFMLTVRFVSLLTSLTST